MKWRHKGLMPCGIQKMNDSRKKLAIIGASYLQNPLILKAKEMGIETHVFAWQVGDIGEYSADYFYPISIVEKEQILDKCREIGIDGICSIASDLASITVNYVAHELGLVCNSPESVKKSTNKHIMRKCFEECGDPSPKSFLVENASDLSEDIQYPVIVKPLDRSGSRGITKLESAEGLSDAINVAKECGFIKKALVEEYVGGDEYSVEFISWKGKHEFLALTKKYTTGSPHFIETGHLEPAPVLQELEDKIKLIIQHALTSLGIENGASHSEVKITEDGSIKIIEIGARMGGDQIGASLVELTTGFDFVKAVIDISLGMEPYVEIRKKGSAGVRFVFSENDLKLLDRIKQEHPELLVEENIDELTDTEVVDSGSRFGYYLLFSRTKELLIKYLSC